MSRHVLSTRQTGDTQLSLFGTGEVPPPGPVSTTPANREHIDRWAAFQGQPRGSVDQPTAFHNSPLHRPGQLQLFIDPTEHISRTHRSTDENMLDDYTDAAWNEPAVSAGSYDRGLAKYAGPNPAPNDTMQKVMKIKEGEARQPGTTYDVHGSGMYDIIASGEQIQKPIEVRIHDWDNEEEDEQYEGHHRVAAGHAVQRDLGKEVYLPVTYHEQPWAKSKRQQAEAPILAEHRNKHSPTHKFGRAWM